MQASVPQNNIKQLEDNLKDIGKLDFTLCMTS